MFGQKNNTNNENTVRQVMWSRYFPLVVLIAVICAPLFQGSTYVTRVVAMAGVYAILALGLNLFFGYCGQVSFGHAGFFAVGAYITTLMAIRLNLPFLVTIPCAVAITAVVAVLVGLPLVRVRGHYLALATMSFGEICYYTSQRWISVTGGEGGLNVPEPAVFGYSLDGRGFYYVLIFMVIISFLACERLVHSRVGRAMMALGQNETAAYSLGINVTKYKTIGFMVCGLLAGLAGGLFSYYTRWISPESFSINVSILTLVMIVIGGFSSNVGSLIGAAFVAFVPEVLQAVVGPFSNVEMLVWGVLIVLALFYMPEGIAGLFGSKTEDAMARMAKSLGGKKGKVEAT
jgi:branched-chain amino acid transport system permease protein